MNIHNFHGNQRRFHRVLTVHLIDSSHESAYNKCKLERTDSPMKLNADIVYEGLKKKYPVTMSGPKSTQLTISRPELYLDNDAAGRKASAEIASAMESASVPGRVEDLSHLYREYNDVNDYLKANGNTPFKLSSYGNTREQELREEGDHLP